MEFAQTQRSVGELIAETEGTRLASGDPATRVTGITQDSRRVEPGDLFVAISGFERDGLDYLPEALSRGAAAIAAEAQNPHRVPSGESRVGVPLILVDNARRALADLSAAFYRHPSKHLPVVGVTGTDGKTSTTQLLSGILEARGLKTGWLTTVNTKIADVLRPNAADHTTPEAPIVQRTLHEMRQADLDVAVLETSSHALELERVRATCFQVGVFTNLSPEHINFHGSFDAYRAAKRKLFERLPPDGLAVLNADDPSIEVMRAGTRARVLTYGVDAPDADLTVSDIRLSPGGTTFTLLPAGVRIQTRLVGRFNVSNWLAAYAAATYFGATPEELRCAASTQPPVPGRMNLVDTGQPFAVIVDFAHTPQALEKALDTVRSLTRGRLLLAFGLAGGRDHANRPVMGALAARKADFFVITMDDPGHEDAAAIADQIAEGARSAGADQIAEGARSAGADQIAEGARPAGADFEIELDRRKALRLLFERARRGDAVLLAGKGHEQRMVVGDERRPWNDARAAAEILAELGLGVQAVP